MSYRNWGQKWSVVGAAVQQYSLTLSSDDDLLVCQGATCCPNGIHPMIELGRVLQVSSYNLSPAPQASAPEPLYIYTSAPRL